MDKYVHGVLQRKGLCNQNTRKKRSIIKCKIFFVCNTHTHTHKNMKNIIQESKKKRKKKLFDLFTPWNWSGESRDQLETCFTLALGRMVIHTNIVATHWFIPCTEQAQPIDLPWVWPAQTFHLPWVWPEEGYEFDLRRLVTCSLNNRVWA